MRFVCLSDTHMRHDSIAVPEGDVLLHAGDFTRRGTVAEVVEFDRWLASLPHRHKVVVAGNHDFSFQREPLRARQALSHATYLEDSGTEIDGIRIWGSPWQPWFHDWAFNLRRGKPLRERWALVPAGTDVLITHGPPAGILDRTSYGEEVGCEELLAALPRIRPRVHLFGHIHEACGVETLDGTLCINASICDLAYRPANPPREFDLAPADRRATPEL